MSPEQIKGKIKKVRQHPSQNEGLIFEKSSPGKKGYKLSPLDVPAVDAAKLLGATERKHLGQMPEGSEFEIILHFTHLSAWTYAIALAMYPLPSAPISH